ncbi:MAG TPA: hypothetical protein VF171_06610 [Trueperaceae bacterium]
MDQRTAKAVEREFALYPIYLQAVDNRQRSEADRSRPWPPAAPRPEAQPSNRPAVAVVQMSADPEYERARRSVAAIQAAYANLDPLAQRFVDLYCWQARSAAQVQEVLDVSERTLRRIKARVLEEGLRQLRRHQVPNFVGDECSADATAVSRGEG